MIGGCHSALKTNICFRFGFMRILMHCFCVFAWILIISDSLCCFCLIKKYFRDCQGLVKWGYKRMFSWIVYFLRYTTITKPKYAINSWIFNIKLISKLSLKIILMKMVGLRHEVVMISQKRLLFTLRPYILY